MIGRALLVNDFVAPAGGPAGVGFHILGPEVDGVFLFVGEEEVVETVAVEIDEAEAVVLAALVDEGQSGGEGVGEFFSSALGVGPREDGICPLVRNQEFTPTIPVHVA